MLKCTAIADTDTNQSRSMGLRIGVVGADGEVEEVETEEVEEVEVEEVELEAEVGDTRQHIGLSRESRLARNLSSRVLELNAILTVSSEE